MGGLFNGLGNMFGDADSSSLLFFFLLLVFIFSNCGAFGDGDSLLFFFLLLAVLFCGCGSNNGCCENASPVCCS